MQGNLKTSSDPSIQGLLLLNKPRGKTSFNMVSALRRVLGVSKIGHTGTLDPFATGVLVMLIGRAYTRLSDHYLSADKEYLARVCLGIETDSYDCDGEIKNRSSHIPTLSDLERALLLFQGEIEQIPPMFSAKKVGGRKLYELARQGKTIERAPVRLTVSTELIAYSYPYIDIKISCSKGTYIRSIAHDLGQNLGCGGHLVELQRTRSGDFEIGSCFDGARLFSEPIDKVTLQGLFVTDQRV